mgnify:FL=1|jgi:hypothetical protein|tara:strand:+ start:60 stop:485 length:426 start_codon:yes stop_codon:yes gene_type:complete
MAKTPEKPEVFTVQKNQFGDAEVDNIDLTVLKEQVTSIESDSIAPIVYKDDDYLHQVKGVLGDPPEDVAYLINELQKKVKALEAQVEQYHARNDAEDNIQQDYDNIIKQNQSALTQLDSNHSSMSSTIAIIQDTLKRHGIS